MPTDISTALRSTASRASNESGQSNTAISVAEQRQSLPPAAKPAASEKSESTDKEVGKIVEELNIKVQNIRRELQFSYNDSTGHTVISVIDSNTKEVIRQIPEEEVVALAEHFDEHTGVLVQTKA